MAGLDPAISNPVVASLIAPEVRYMRGGWVYILTNRRDGVLYIGVTSNLARRIWEHREGAVDGFTRKYRLKRLVWAEHHNDIQAAIQRKKNIKHWPRSWKVDLILAQNPDWLDLFDQLT
jgi:putative endonuclease